LDRLSRGKNLFSGKKFVKLVDRIVRYDLKCMFKPLEQFHIINLTGCQQRIHDGCMMSRMMGTGKQIIFLSNATGRIEFSIRSGYYLS